MLLVHIGRLCAVAVLAAVPALAGLVPARAAEPAELALVLPGVTVPVGTSGTPVTPHVTTTADFQFGPNTTTYTLSGPGELSLPPRSDCERPTAKKIVCARTGLLVRDYRLNPLHTVIVTAEEASAGAGQLTVTLTADSTSTLTATARVRTAAGVDLAAGPSSSKSVPFGGSVDVPVQVSNRGDGVARGAAVLFTYSQEYQFKAGKTFTNCSYLDDLPVSCLFDRELAVGAGYRAALPFQVREDAYSPSSGYEVQQLWVTPAELEDLGDLGKPGTGGTLTLDALAQTLADPQADPEKGDNSARVIVAVTGPTRWIDLEGIGDRATGKVGDVVTVTVGIRNLGPAVFLRDFGVATSFFTVPPGTTVVGDISEQCATKGDNGLVDQSKPAEPGRDLYYCDSTYRDFLVGDSETIDFRLRIDKVIPNAKGTFKAGGGPCQRECPIFQSDTNLKNNEVPVIVNAGATPPPGDGGGGGLPVTGPTSALIAAAGLALTAGGALLLLAVRRRERRTTGA